MVLRTEEEEDFLIAIHENKSNEEEKEGEKEEEIEEVKEEEEEENEENNNNDNNEKNRSRNRNRNRNRNKEIEIEIDSYREIDYNNTSKNENMNKNMNKNINRNMNRKISPSKRYQSQKFIILILSLLLCICLIYFLIDRTLFHHSSGLTYATHEKFIFTTSSSSNSNSNNIHSHNDDFIEGEEPPQGFMYLRKSRHKGPITLDRARDDGSKLNLYSMMITTTKTNTTTTANSPSENREKDENHNENKDYIYENFKKLEEILPSQSQYLCELDNKKPPESQKGYILTCPKYYTLLIEKAYFGRYENDKINCIKNKMNTDIEVEREREREKEKEKEWEWKEGEEENDSSMNLIQYCGIDSTSTMKELCEGRRTCEVKPYPTFFISLCSMKNKYLHVEYHCIKDLEIKTPRIAIVNYINEMAMEKNSIFENSVSEFFQYSQIHGYTYQLYRKRYNTERDIFYMKLNSMIESLILGLKEKTYDWIFWADSDTIITNPNIKLETFLPIGEDGYEEDNEESNGEEGNEEEKEKEKQKEKPQQHSNSNSIHFIASDDENGLNAGVYLIRVHPWSLNLLMRAMAYPYYHEETALRYSDQSSLSNILIENGEEEHYVIVPQHWFNSYPHTYHSGDFLIHFAGEADKDWRARDIRMKLKHHISRYTSKTSKEMRKEVLEYYRLPREEQHQIGYQE